MNAQLVYKFAMMEMVYPADIFGRIGDPFIKRRDTFISKDSHPEYEGMGLGLFIAKNTTRTIRSANFFF